MEVLIPIGAVVALTGLAGLLWCIVIAARARKSGGTEAEIKARLQRALVINMSALFLSAIGLMMVVIGILL